jgi:hypothetical protein
VYDLIWDEEAKAELAALRAFRRRIVMDAVSRQLRHRVLYRIADARTVRVLRVILKGTTTLSGAVGGSDHEG